MPWEIHYYSERQQREIMDLPPGLLARYLRYGDLMEVHGPNLGMPHTRALGDGLFEIRLKGAEGIARVLYCTLVEQRIVMLHQFLKKSQKIPSRELRVARARMKEVRDAQS
jgi:phage-related protein